MSGEHRKNQRRTMMVNKPAQMRMLKRLLLVPAIGLASMGLLVILSIVGLLMEVQAANFVLASLPLVVWSVALFVGGSAGFLFMTSFRFTYRIAGPTYRILRALEDFQDQGGELNIRLREGDELQDLADKLNEVMHDLQAEPYGAPSTEGTRSEAELPTLSTAD